MSKQINMFLTFLCHVSGGKYWSMFMMWYLIMYVQNSTTRH